ncbi:MAG: hypothetical protein ACYTJ0_15775, partial [Planctomycetota bacterium]
MTQSLDPRPVVLVNPNRTGRWRGPSLATALLVCSWLAACTVTPPPEGETTLAMAPTRAGAEPPPGEAEPDPPSRLAAPAALATAEPRTTPSIERLPWTFDGADGTEIRTPNFRLYTTLRSPRWLERLPLFYENGLHHYRTALGTLPPPPEPLHAFIFRDNRQWKNKTREILPDEADVFMTLGRGGFTTEGTSVLYYIGPRDTYAIAAHEGWHQYTQRTFRHPLPIWLEEGIAAYMEAMPTDPDDPLRAWDNDERHSELAQAWRRDKLLPLRELLTTTPQKLLARGKNRLLTYYAQVWALARFLHEGEDGRYRPALEQLLSDAAEGKITGRVLESRDVRMSRRWGVQQQIRNGPLILLEYFNRDLGEIGGEYDRFVA